MNKKRILSLMVLAGSIACHAQVNQRNTASSVSHPNFAIKTNLLYDATSTINLGGEFRLGNRTTLEVPVNYNPWTFSDNKKWKHFLVQPEYRRWTREAFNGHFFGLHAHYAFYNVGALDNPPFSKYMNTHRFEGWLAGVGISYGYRWKVSGRWSMEATLGAGYAFLSYDKYPCKKCGEKLGSGTKNYFGPTKAGISLIYGINRQKKAVPQAPVQRDIPPVPFTPVEKPVYEPVLSVTFVTPEAETVKRRSASGKAYLDFPVNASVIRPEFRNNAAELQRIYNLINTIKNDPDASISGISITGYASPEGKHQANQTLSEKRAAALADHLKRQYGFEDNLLLSKGGGEDWVTLDSLVAQSDMQYKEQILNIIRSTGIFDGREKKLMELASGAPYREMLGKLFPKLRRSDYELAYTILPFTVEKGKEVIRTRPSSLSLNEMFLIANTYQPGSQAFNEVFETAARMFPQDDTANVNAAASALQLKDVHSAEKYLGRITGKGTAYWNNAGVLAALKKDYAKAEECFAKARTAGNSQAIHNAGEIEKTK